MRHESVLVPQATCRRAVLWALFAAIALTMPYRAGAETQAQACDRLAGDTVKMDSIDGEAAQAACSNAVASAPQDKHLQYEYARALERTAKRDQAKQLYQWLASDGYAPASAALTRLAGPLTGEAAEREKLAEKLDAIAAIAARIAKATPRDHDDPNTVLAKTGKDPAKILAWVKANTRIVPYAGMLRGASGVLMDRAGNSLDRALFLADLLHRAGYNVRIARAQISPQAAEALRARFINSALKPVPPAVPDKATLLKAIGTDPRLDPKLVEMAVDKSIAGSQKFNAEVQSLYGRVLPAVLQAIGNDPARDVRLAADADAVLRDHFWVQRQNNAGWDDLDPDADIVAKPVAASTFTPSETPPSLKHRVTLRLVLETLTDGKLSETPLLQRSWLPSEIADKSIVINHSLYPQVSVDAAFQSSDPQATYLDQLVNASVVMPVLQVGKIITKGQLYAFDGRVEAPTPENLASLGGIAIVNANRLSSGIASVFGGSTPAPVPTKASATMAAAEWLEIEVSVPGRPVERHRRAIFDFIGDGARASSSSIDIPAVTDDMKRTRARALNGTIDACVLASAPEANSIAAKINERLSQGLTRSATALRDAKTLAEILSSPPENKVEMPIWSWAISRTLLSSYPLKPNIALFWWTPSLQNDMAKDAIALDIVENTSVSNTSFTSRVAQGVFDTVLEHVVLSGSSHGKNAAAMMALDISSNHSWERISADSRGTLDDSIFSASDKAAIVRTVERGKTVIAPALHQNADAVWWDIDTRTGQTIGVDATGRGTAVPEETLILLNFISAASCFAKAGRLPDNSKAQAIKVSLCTMGFIVGNAGIIAGFMETASIRAATGIAVAGAGVSVAGDWLGP